jgi:hypothetical protein
LGQRLNFFAVSAKIGIRVFKNCHSSASYGQTYADGSKPCSNHSIDEASGLAVFSWLFELRKEVAMPVSNRLDDKLLDVPTGANVCLENALTGEPLPIHNQSMQDIIDYCGLLNASNEPPRYALQQATGQEVAQLSASDWALLRQFDPKLYQDHCTGCHIRH